jgi:dihydroxyacetone kinase
VAPLGRADEVADEMTKLVMDDFEATGNTPSEVAVLVSGLGATPVNELYVLFDRVAQELEARGARVHKAWVGNYFTSLEMVGRL